MSKYLIGISTMLLLMACKSQKMAVQRVEEMVVMPDKVIAESILTDRYSFKTLKIKKINVDFVINNVSRNFKANMAIAKDSLIVISVTPMLGFEAMRILCTNDSIIVINRSERTVHVSSVESYMRKYSVPTGFKDMQSVLVNEAFIYGPGVHERNIKNKVERMDGMILFNMVSFWGDTRLYQQTIKADGKSYQVQDLWVEDYIDKMQLYIRYGDFKRYDTINFPGKIEVDIVERNQVINLKIVYGQVVFDDPINVDFSIPEHYTRKIL